MSPPGRPKRPARGTPPEVAPASPRPKRAAAGTSERGGAGAPQLRLRMRVMAGDVIAIGPGKVALLEAIAVTGSLTGAAKHLGMSYRRAWVLLDELNRSLRTPAVASAKGGEGGGGSELTDCGRELVALYRLIEDGARLACAADIRRLLGLVAR